MERIKPINAVLLMLSKDEDLSDDLKLKEVKIAIDHWTGKSRLMPEQANKLQNHRRVVYVLQRLQMLQHVCREANLPVPLDHLLNGLPELNSQYITSNFSPVDSSAKKARTNDSNKDNKTSVHNAETNNINKVIDAPIISVKKSSTSIESITQDSNINKTIDAPVSTEKESVTSIVNKKYSINDLLKIAIMIVVVLIALTLSQLPIFKFS